MFTGNEEENKNGYNITSNSRSNEQENVNLSTFSLEEAVIHINTLYGLSKQLTEQNSLLLQRIQSLELEQSIQRGWIIGVNNAKSAVK